MAFYVYFHRNATTGEIFYVGKGQGDRAWSLSGRSQHWLRVVAKYGYTVEIVASGLQEWYAFELEKDLIALYGRKDSKQGPLINKTDGGEGSSGLLQSNKTVCKRAAAIKKVWATKNGRENMQKGANARGKRCRKQVHLLDYGTAFLSQKHALAWLKEGGFTKASAGSLNNAISGKYLTYCTLRWGHTPDQNQRASKKGHQARPVINKTTGEVYKSCTEAGNAYGVPKGNIWAAAKKKAKTSCKCEWEFL